MLRGKALFISAFFVYPNHPRGSFTRCRVRKSKPVEKLLTIQQLSELTQLRRSTLYEWTHSGFIPHYKFPKGVPFKATEIEGWLNKKKRKESRTHRIQI